MIGTRWFACAALIVGLAVPQRAGADAAKAWAAAKANLPSSTSVVIGVDTGAIAKSALFGKLFELALARRPDATAGLELVKSACNLDPLAASPGIVYGADAAQTSGAIFIALARGVDQRKLVSCVETILKAKGADGASSAKLTITKTGAIHEAALGTDKAYFAWIGSDVLVLPLDIANKDQLAAWIGHKGAFQRSTVGKLLAKVDPKSAAWGASAVPKSELGFQMTHAYGKLTIAGGNLGADLRIALDSATSASAAAMQANTQLAEVKGGLPANIQALLDKVTVAPNGAEVVVKANVPEAELMSILSAFLRP